MKFRAEKEWGEPNHHSGFRLILTLTNVEHRLYVWWKRVGSINPLPIEYQRRVVLNRPARKGINPDGSTWIEHYPPSTWPKRRVHR